MLLESFSNLFGGQEVQLKDLFSLLMRLYGTASVIVGGSEYLCRYALHFHFQ